MTPERLVHHELCFGCGRTNLFGLLMDVERTGPRHVRGRGFIKQDHQGAVRGTAHEGVIAAALSDAMALVCGAQMRPIRVEVDLSASVPVGSFLDIQAEGSEPDGQVCRATASAFVDEEPVAGARGIYGRA